MKRLIMIICEKIFSTDRNNKCYLLIFSIFVSLCLLSFGSFNLGSYLSGRFNDISFFYVELFYHEFHIHIVLWLFLSVCFVLLFLEFLSKYANRKGILLLTILSYFSIIIIFSGNYVNHRVNMFFGGFKSYILKNIDIGELSEIFIRDLKKQISIDDPLLMHTEPTSVYYSGEGNSLIIKWGGGHIQWGIIIFKNKKTETVIYKYKKRICDGVILFLE